MSLTNEDCSILLSILNQIKGFGVKEARRVGEIMDKLEIMSQQKDTVKDEKGGNK